MKIKNLSFKDLRWDRFCLESDDCWFYHTTDWMRYTLEYGGTDSELLSFYVEDGNGEILAICPLIRHQNKFLFSGNNGPNPALRNGLSSSLSKKLIRQIFVHIDLIAMEHEITECIMSLTPLAKNHLKIFTYNYLMRYGYENISLNTQILDLSKDEKILWGEIKKSHRNEIKKGKKIFNFRISEPYSDDKDFFTIFQNLHFLAAERKTRSDLSWEFQQQWIAQGNAILINAYYEDIPVGGIYSITYKKGALYGVSANHPDYDQKHSISHSIQWEMIKWLKYNRYNYYELGIQQFSNQPYDHPSQKDLDISLFKRHFGGYTKTFHRGIKKYQ